MKAVFLKACAALTLTASLSACATGIGGANNAGVDVTRFHLGQQVARSTIAVQPGDAADGNSLEYATYRAAVERQLARLGWTVVPTSSQSEQIALIDVEQGSRAALAQRSPISIGVGVGSGGRRSGVGIGASTGIGGSRSRQLVTTQLEVSIRRRSDSTVFWEGRAQTEARSDSPYAYRTTVIEKLADALFRDFPGESGRTIRVR